jgi:hypothetical protein
MGMVPINRKKISLYEEAKNGISSLVWQTATVFVGFIFMLLLTVGNPSSFAITIIFILGIAFVAWREQNRVTKLMGADSDDFLNERKMLTKHRQLRYQQKAENKSGKSKSYKIIAVRMLNDNQSVDLRQKTDEVPVDKKIAVLKVVREIAAQVLSSEADSLNANKSGIKRLVREIAAQVLSSEADSLNANKSGIKRLLYQLEELIVIDSNLNDEEKADAVEHLKALNQIALKGQSTKQPISRSKTSEP